MAALIHHSMNNPMMHVELEIDTFLEIYKKYTRNG